MKATVRTPEEKPMPTKILITIKNVTIEAEFLDTACAKAVAEKPAIETTPNELGGTSYFENPCEGIPRRNCYKDYENRRHRILPSRKGPSHLLWANTVEGNEPFLTSEVNCVGSILGDATILRKTKSALSITLKKIP